MNLNQRLKDKIKTLPQSPGIYLFRDEWGGVIYIGKAVRIRSRVRSHFSGRDPTPKADVMIESVRDIDHIPLKSEEEALILECQYIKEFKPKYNILLRDDKTYPHLKVTMQEDFPRLIITRMKKPDGALYLGPYTDATALNKTVETLNKIFHIRTCTLSHPGQKNYDHCLYQMMKWCTAPCVGKISKEDYRQSVENAVQVLLGHSPFVLSRLRSEMEEASKNMKFEKAAMIRDELQALEQIVGIKRRSLRNFKRISNEADREAEELSKVLGLDHVPVRIEAFDISNLFGEEAVGSMVHFHQGAPDKRFYRRFKIRTVQGIDDFGMIHEVVSRRYRRLKEEGGPFPDLILIDGGKGQLSSAISAMEELALEKIPMIGLAKRYEEIVTPYAGEIRLGRDSSALHLIQRIRDEAHRFAVTYHKILRDKKIQESILDDIPGIGPAKKKALLEKFGSVQAIQKAGLDEVKRISGLSQDLVEKIFEGLKKKK